MYLCCTQYNTFFFSVEEMQIDPGCSSQQLFVQKFLFFNSGVSGTTFFFPSSWNISGLIGQWKNWNVLGTNPWVGMEGKPNSAPLKPMLRHHIMLSFSQQTWMKSKIWSQKITTSIKWIQVFWDKYSMGLFQNKMSNGTVKMGLPSILWFSDWPRSQINQTIFKTFDFKDKFV